MSITDHSLEHLQAHWTHLYRDYLPALAKARDPAQKNWPVHLDHCFARIVLDNAVGIFKPWTDVLKSPAIRHMSTSQLRSAIALAEQIVTGEVDLDALNEHSLQLRGKKRKADDNQQRHVTLKRQNLSKETISSYFLPSPDVKSAKDEAPVSGVFAKGYFEDGVKSDQLESSNVEDTSEHLKEISDSNLTPFRKQMLKLLCQIPRGRYSTYQAMSDHITQTSHKTCARAVGNAMRNNPFAPRVPCHRVLAADRSLGGFNGYWGEGGKYASQKHRLLHDEGIRFDSRGKAKGPPFTDFKT